MKFKKTILIISTLAILPTITVYAKERTQSSTGYFSSGSKKEQCFANLEVGNHRISMNKGNGKSFSLSLRETRINALDPAVARLETNATSATSSYAKTRHAEHYIRFESGQGAGYAMIAH